MIFNEYLNSLFIFSFSDLTEIIFFSSLIYCCSIWLKNDKQKNLLASFYILLSIFISSNFFQLTNVTNFFISFFPVILVVFFLIHQRTLQKNFIALKKIQPAKNFIDNDWVDSFMRAIFNAMSNNKQMTCIIEGQNSLADFIKTPFTISAPISKELIDILINSHNYEQQKMMWISWDGKINAINGIWNIKNYELWFSENSQNMNDWQQDAIIFTSKINCILFRTYPSKRTLDIVLQGRLIEDMSPNNALNLISQFIKKNEIQTLKKDEETNEINNKKSWSKQPYA
jgi:hypothetical protein